jgi:hypothetical protein
MLCCDLRCSRTDGLPVRIPHSPHIQSGFGVIEENRHACIVGNLSYQQLTDCTNASTHFGAESGGTILLSSVWFCTYGESVILLSGNPPFCPDPSPRYAPCPVLRLDRRKKKNSITDTPPIRISETSKFQNLKCQHLMIIRTTNIQILPSQRLHSHLCTAQSYF